MELWLFFALAFWTKFWLITAVDVAALTVCFFIALIDMANNFEQGSGPDSKRKQKICGVILCLAVIGSFLIGFFA